MPVTREEIESFYSRVPLLLKPPPTVLVIKNATIGAERLYQAAHTLNAERWHIFGLHRMGTDTIVVAGDAGASTPVHEAVHFNGVRSEFATRLITRLLQARMNFNLGILRAPVHYHEEPLGPDETARILHDLNLSNPTGGNVQMVRLVYTPG